MKGEIAGEGVCDENRDGRQDPYWSREAVVSSNKRNISG